MTKKQLYKKMNLAAKAAWNATSDIDRKLAELEYNEAWRKIDRNYPSARTFNIAISLIDLN